MINKWIHMYFMVMHNTVPWYNLFTTWKRNCHASHFSWVVNVFADHEKKLKMRRTRNEKLLKISIFQHQFLYLLLWYIYFHLFLITLVYMCMNVNGLDFVFEKIYNMNFHKTTKRTKLIYTWIHVCMYIHTCMFPVISKFLLYI